MNLTDLRKVIIQLLKEGKVKYFTVGEGEDIKVGYEGTILCLEGLT